MVACVVSGCACDPPGFCGQKGATQPLVRRRNEKAGSLAPTADGLIASLRKRMRGAEVIACPVEAPLPGRSEGARGVERQRLEGIESTACPLWPIPQLTATSASSIDSLGNVGGKRVMAAPSGKSVAACWISRARSHAGTPRSCKAGNHCGEGRGRVCRPTTHNNPHPDLFRICRRPPPSHSQPSHSPRSLTIERAAGNQALVAVELVAGAGDRPRPDLVGKGEGRNSPTQPGLADSCGIAGRSRRVIALAVTG